MRTIYDVNGSPKVVESVDAREHLETGRWFTAPPDDQEPKQPIAALESGKRKKGDSK